MQRYEKFKALPYYFVPKARPKKYAPERVDKICYSCYSCYSSFLAYTTSKIHLYLYIYKYKISFWLLGRLILTVATVATVAKTFLTSIFFSGSHVWHFWSVLFLVLVHFIDSPCTTRLLLSTRFIILIHEIAVISSFTPARRPYRANVPTYHRAICKIHTDSVDLYYKYI